MRCASQNEGQRICATLPLQTEKCNYHLLRGIRKDSILTETLLFFYFIPGQNKLIPNIYLAQGISRECCQMFEVFTT